MMKKKEVNLIESAIRKIREDPDSYELVDVERSTPSSAHMTLDVDEFGEVTIHDTGYYAFSETEDGDISWSFNTGPDAEISINGEKGSGSAKATNVETEFYMESDDGSKNYRYFTVIVDEASIPDWLKQGQPPFKDEDDSDDDSGEREIPSDPTVNTDTLYFRVLESLPSGWFTTDEAVEETDYRRSDITGNLATLRRKGLVEDRDDPPGRKKEYRVTEEGREALQDVE